MPLQISAIQQFTTLDYPGKLACIVFFAGCNFRCSYCHNPEFVLAEEINKIKASFIKEEDFFNFLSKREGLLDAVVISGGEATLVPNLKEFIKKIKDLGFLVKLDTNGSKPELIKDLINQQLIDYIAMDLKSSFEHYPELVCKKIDIQDLQESINFIKDSGIEYEFRSTLIKEVHTQEILSEMSKILKGSKKVFLQSYRNDVTIDKSFANYHAFSSSEMQYIAELFGDGSCLVQCR